MQLSILIESIRTLPAGIALTITLTFASLALGLVLSLPLAIVRAGSNAWLSGAVLAYTYSFRGTPLLVQLFIVYYGLGQLAFVQHSALWPFLRQPFWCAFIALTLNSTAHTTEILRGAIRSVPRGQIEAAKALGLRDFHRFRFIVLPISLRIAFPAYCNEVVGMLKATSLTSTITLLEITGLARKIVSDTFAPYEVFVVAGGLYLLLTIVTAAALRFVERRLALPDHAKPQDRRRCRIRSKATAWISPFRRRLQS
jgi:octopine/nopaline transport system permease protein